MLDIDESLQQSEPDSSRGLKSSNLILRKPAERDLGNLVALATNPQLAKTLCANPFPQSLDAAQSWLSCDIGIATGQTHFVLSTIKGSFIGAAGLYRHENGREAEMVVLIRQALWRQGFATRAAQALADFAFSNPNPKDFDLNAVTATTRVCCSKSRRVAEKCGFQYAGTGMAHSAHFRGMIPIDRFRLDRGIWKALRSWGQSIPEDFAPKGISPDNFKGAA